MPLSSVMAILGLSILASAALALVSALLRPRWRIRTIWAPWERWNEIAWGATLSLPRCLAGYEALLTLNLGRAEFQISLEVW